MLPQPWGPGMFVINFAHPIAESQTEVIARLANHAVERVLAVDCQVDQGRPFAEQVRAIVDGVGLTPDEWQTLPLLVNLPSLAPVAATLLAELHGRCGYFPPVVRVRAVSGSTPPRFEVAEIIDLNRVREAARGQRSVGART
jgi:hypothetical protein